MILPSSCARPLGLKIVNQYRQAGRLESVMTRDNNSITTATVCSHLNCLNGNRTRPSRPRLYDFTIFSWPIPIRRLAFRANAWLLLGVPRHPFMSASLASITHNSQLNFCHDASILLVNILRQVKDFSLHLCTLVVIYFVGKSATETRVWTSKKNLKSDRKERW